MRDSVAAPTGLLQMSPELKSLRCPKKGLLKPGRNLNKIWHESGWTWSLLNCETRALRKTFRRNHIYVCLFVAKVSRHCLSSRLHYTYFDFRTHLYIKGGACGNGSSCSGIALFFNLCSNRRCRQKEETQHADF